MSDIQQTEEEECSDIQVSGTTDEVKNIKKAPKADISGGYTAKQVRDNISAKVFFERPPVDKHCTSECWEDFRQLFRKDGTLVEHW